MTDFRSKKYQKIKNKRFGISVHSPLPLAVLELCKNNSQIFQQTQSIHDTSVKLTLQTKMRYPVTSCHMAKYMTKAPSMNFKQNMNYTLYDCKSA